MLRDRLNDDLKTAMLARDTVRVSVIRSLKSAITYTAVAARQSEADLADATVLEVFVKEAKKRQESADSYAAAARTGQAAGELAEKAIIETYLPQQVGEAELRNLVDQAVGRLEDPSPRAMGQIIAAVKADANGRVDGAMLAGLVKERLRAA